MRSSEDRFKAYKRGVKDHNPSNSKATQAADVVASQGLGALPHVVQPLKTVPCMRQIKIDADVDKRRRVFESSVDVEKCLLAHDNF